MSDKQKREQEIDTVLAALRKAWLEAPQLRLCQLINNVTEMGEVLYYIDDQKLAQLFGEFYHVARKANITLALRGMESKCLDDADDLHAVIDKLTDAL